MKTENVVHSLLLVQSHVFLFAQGFARLKTITEHVTEELGQALKSGAVVVPGTANSSMSNNDGRFSGLAQSGAQIRFTFFGLAEQVVSVAGSSVIENAEPGFE
ncbi:hypothetical protein [Mangrovibacterium sp.]|uniref:hypothetical protein n=1 Tax=Mangrovibacterium sp. TaxID=1961364 RepID=UPI0035671FD4